MMDSLSNNELSLEGPQALMFELYAERYGVKPRSVFAEALSLGMTALELVEQGYTIQAVRTSGNETSVVKFEVEDESSSFDVFRKAWAQSQL